MLGCGGFGAVYKVRISGERPWHGALKETFNPDMAEQFEKEFEILKNLEHPHLPKYYHTFRACENWECVKVEYGKGGHACETACTGIAYR